MKKTLTLLALSLALITSPAAILNFDLSPAGTDFAVGLSPLNEVPVVTNSTGSGNEIGTGITFDTDTLLLSLSIGYGSAFGFGNLTGPATVMHIHGPAPTNVAASVLINLSTNHTFATNPATGGFIGGTVQYTAEQAVFLLAGSNYINIHTATNPAGEIRAQLIPANSPPTAFCPLPATLECDGSGGRLVAITAQINDIDGDALSVLWTVDGAPIQTNNVPAGGPPTSADTSLLAFLTLGQHQVVVTVSDGAANGTCSTTVAVVDTTPPVITSASASPNVLWPPNHKMVPITISVVATDLCASASCRIKSVTSNEQIQHPGKKNKSPDWSTNGPLALQLRAERSGKSKNGRTYNVTVECTDPSGNASTRTVVITVPHDQGKKSGNNNSSNGNSSNGNSNGNSSNGNSNGNSGSNGNSNSGSNSNNGKGKKT